MEETPFEDRSVPRAEIDWDRSCWWWFPLTRSVQPAIRLTTMVFSFVAVWLAGLGIFLGNLLFRPRWDSESYWMAADFSTFRTPSLRPVIVDWSTAAISSFASFEALGLTEFAFVLFVIVWLSSVFSLFGGVLARRAAVELGQRTVATWSDSVRFVGRRWGSCFWATGMHLFGIAALLLPVLILGWLTLLGTPGAIIAGIGLILLFPLIAAIGRLMLSATVCYPLSICTIALEKKGDAFEGFSRSNAYLFQRPVVAVICGFLLLLVGAVGELVVYWTLTLGWGLVSGALVATGGGASEGVRTLGTWCVGSLLAAYWFGFFWSAAAALYLILRKSVDNYELDEMEIIENALEMTLPPIPTTSQPAPAATTEVGADPPSTTESA